MKPLPVVLIYGYNTYRTALAIEQAISIVGCIISFIAIAVVVFGLLRSKKALSPENIQTLSRVRILEKAEKGIAVIYTVEDLETGNRLKLNVHRNNAKLSTLVIGDEGKVTYSNGEVLARSMGEAMLSFDKI